MKNKKAQNAIGMSFSTIFSIILIIVFIAFAFVGIKFFLGFSQTAQINQFYRNFQESVDITWKSSETNFSYQFNLPKKVQYICFIDFSEQITAYEEIYESVNGWSSKDLNLILFPPEFNPSYKKIAHINITEIIKEKNPYCLQNPGELTLIKELYTKSVIIT